MYILVCDFDFLTLILYHYVWGLRVRFRVVIKTSSWKTYQRLVHPFTYETKILWPRPATKCKTPIRHTIMQSRTAKYDSIHQALRPMTRRLTSFMNIYSFVYSRNRVVWEKICLNSIRFWTLRIIEILIAMRKNAVRCKYKFKASWISNEPWQFKCFFFYNCAYILYLRCPIVFVRY